MGIDYKCGCRVSMGHWFLCMKHEAMLESKIEEIKGDVIIDEKG